MDGSVKSESRPDWCNRLMAICLSRGLPLTKVSLMPSVGWIKVTHSNGHSHAF